MRRMILLPLLLGLVLFPHPAHSEVVKLKNQSTDRCLNIHRGRHDFEGGPVTSYSCADTPDQEWELSRRGGIVKLKNRSTDRCLNIHRGRHDYQGAPVTSYSCAETPDQEWELFRLSNGSVKLQNRATGRFLNIHRGEHDFEGGPVTSYSCADTPDQEWELIRLTGGPDCRIVEAVGEAESDDIVEQLNDEVEGETRRISRRKTLRINRIQSITFEGCEAEVKANVTLKRKIRRDGHGPAILKATITSVDLTKDIICMDRGRVTSVQLSRTTRLGEAVYRWIANKVLPSERCFGATAPC